jgi:hypothetical protein
MIKKISFLILEIISVLKYIIKFLKIVKVVFVFKAINTIIA